MHLYLVRHGECHSESAPGVFTPDGDLSALGERQARRAAERLVAVGITHVLSSPLLRALATARAITEAAGDLPVEVWTELREGYGDMPGAHIPIHRGPGRSELLRRFPRVVLPAAINSVQRSRLPAHIPRRGRERLLFRQHMMAPIAAPWRG